VIASEWFPNSLPQNRKGYIVSNSQNPLRVYVSHDVMFVETSEISGHVTIQVDRQVPKTEEASINNVDTKLEVSQMVTYYL